MKASEVVVPSFGDDDAVFDQNATHQRIGTHFAPASFCNEEGTLHERVIVFTPRFVHDRRSKPGFKTSCLGIFSCDARKEGVYAK
jgi:hypothetical protein